MSLTPVQFRAARAYLGVTQQKIATMVGVHQAVVSQFERAEAIKVGLPDKVAKALGRLGVHWLEDNIMFVGHLAAEAATSTETRASPSEAAPEAMEKSA